MKGALRREDVRGRIKRKIKENLLALSCSLKVPRFLRNDISVELVSKPDMILQMNTLISPSAQSAESVLESVKSINATQYRYIYSLDSSWALRYKR